MDPTQWNVPYPLVVAALFVIVMLRANGTYWLGRAASAGARHTRMAKVMDSPGYLRATQRIDAYGPPVISLSFLTIGFQTLANLAAGATRMSLRHYLPAATIGSVLWAFLYATLGTVGVEPVVRAAPRGGVAVRVRSRLVSPVRSWRGWPAMRCSSLRTSAPVA